MWDWTALTNFSTDRYFKKNKLCFFSMSQIIALIDLFINVFLYMFHTKSCFLRRVMNINIDKFENDEWKRLWRTLSLISICRGRSQIFELSANVRDSCAATLRNGSGSEPNQSGWFGCGSGSGLVFQDLETTLEPNRSVRFEPVWTRKNLYIYRMFLYIEYFYI